MDQLWIFLGRLHPIAVHLPIGIFLLLALVELADRVAPPARLGPGLRTLVLSVGLGAALTAALCGWLLAADGSYDVTLLDRHRWLGLSFSLLTALLFAVRRWPRLYASTLFATIILLGAAGHIGGALTHGENYLRPTVATSRRSVSPDPMQALVFEHVVQPIFEQRCIACHGPTKSNGDLRLDSHTQLAKGGKTGPAIKAGEADASLLVRRAHLPLDAKGHMPPRGKPQLTDDEVALLVWWIEAGAPAGKRVAELSPPPAIAELVASYLGVPRPPPPDRAAMLATAERLERKLGILIRPLTAEGPWLAANARLQFAQFGDAELAELAPISAALHWLDLGETAVTDAGLAALGAMKNLRRLQLDRTALTDAGLTRLSGLTQLELLNLHTTQVTDIGLMALGGLPRLRTLYLWNTRMTPEAVAKFGAQQTNRRAIARWEAEISALGARIRSEQFSANFGEALASPPAMPGPPPPTKPVPASNSSKAAPKVRPDL